jgi:hypothetical protein
MIMCYTTSFHLYQAANFISKVPAIEVQNKVEKKNAEPLKVNMNTIGKSKTQRVLRKGEALSALK